MKSLEVKIASICESFQNRFWFKNVWFLCVIKNRTWRIIIIKPFLSLVQWHIVILDFPQKGLVNYKRQVNTYLALNIKKC